MAHNHPKTVESRRRTLCVDFPVDSAKARAELLALSLIGDAFNPSETVGDGDLPRLNVQPRRGKSFVRPLWSLAVLRGLSQAIRHFRTLLPFGPSPVSASGFRPFVCIIIGDGAFRRVVIGQGSYA